MSALLIESNTFSKGTCPVNVTCSLRESLTTNFLKTLYNHFSRTYNNKMKGKRL